MPQVAQQTLTIMIVPLYSSSTVLEPITSFTRNDGVVVTRFGDRGRDRHAKDIGFYDPNNIFNSDHYDHYLAQNYWEYRTARIQLDRSSFRTVKV